MFTGIIETIVRVQEARPHQKGVTVHLTRPKKTPLKIGQSVALDGICTTVTKTGRSFFEIELMPETLRKTNAASFTKGQSLNFERSLTLSTLVDGHLVQGHIDGVGKILSAKRESRDWLLTLALPKVLLRYVAARGSIAVNGVSLTVAWVERGAFTVALIPYTLKKTNLGELRVGDRVNIETDFLARYLERLVRR